MSVTTIYITTNSKEEAMEIARATVKEKLAACANILGEVSSVYAWNGEIAEEKETALLLKTSEKLIKRLTERVKTLHSYDCPCITALNIVDGNADYITWIKQETL